MILLIHLDRSFARLLALALVVMTAARPAFAQDDGAVHPDPFHERELTCMQQAIAYEAGYEPVSGKQAVAEVILNRTHNPRFPSSVCAVVYQGSERTTGCQFTFTCDGSLRRRLPDEVLEEARQVGEAALASRIPRQVEGAINYHADYVQPYWATGMIRVAKIGRHIFYRPSGSALGPGQAPGSPDASIIAVPGAATLAVEAAAVPRFSLWGLPQPAVRTP